MKHRVVSYAIVLMAMLLIHDNPLHAGSLDGTSSIIYQDFHHVFHDGDIAQGFVRFNNGFTIVSTETGFLDTFITVSGPIDLRETGNLELQGDLYLDSSATWSSGGNIYGNGQTLHLGGNLSIPDGKVIHISSDTIINGHGCCLTTGNRALFFVDHDVTFTLKNLTFKTTKNFIGLPAIKLADHSGKLALENVTLKLTDDFDFYRGQLFIHGDVRITGTHKFMYGSTVKSFIAPCAEFKFEKDTTFFYYPSTFDKELICMQSKASNLNFDNATLQCTHTGIRLTQGRICLDNCVTLSTQANTKLLNVGSGINIENQRVSDVSWSPDSQYIATTDGGDDLLKIYSFDGTSFTITTSFYLGVGNHNKIDWHPDGRYILVSRSPESSNPTTTNTLKIFWFQNDSLNLILQKDDQEYSQWSLDGKHIITQRISMGTDRLQIYFFTGESIFLVDSQSNTVQSPDLGDWHPHGEFFILSPRNVYRFDGTSLTFVTFISIPSNGKAAWSPDGNYLATHTSQSENVALDIYNFDGSSLTFITEGGLYDAPASLEDLGGRVDWNRDGRFVLAGQAPAGGSSPPLGDIQLFRFDYSSTLTRFLGVSTSSITSDQLRVAPNGNYFAIIKNSGSQLTEAYPLQFVFDDRCQSFDEGICFGNANQGESADLDVIINSGTRVCLSGVLNYDNAS